MNRKYMAHGSEGGHSDFASTDARQMRLLEYQLKRFDHVAVERVCSGVGIPNIYEFLRNQERIPERPEVTQSIASAKDHTKAIVDAALDPDNPSDSCRATVDRMVSILASEAGNLALKVLATRWIYLAGGLAMHLLGALHEPQFMQGFTRKGRFTSALIGAATYGLESLRDQKE